MIVSMLLFSGCMEENKYENVPYLNSTIGEFKEESKSSYLIDSDKNNKFYIRNYQQMLDNGFEPGQRVYAEFANPVGEEPFVGEIDVLYAYAVKVKDIVALTEENKDEIGDDPINIYSLWASGKFLNIQFQFFTGSERPHLLNLVTVENPKKQEDGYVYLEFRHNRNNNILLNNYLGIISFNIEDYLANTPDLKGFIIRANTGQGERFLKLSLEEKQMTTDDLSVAPNNLGDTRIIN